MRDPQHTFRHDVFAVILRVRGPELEVLLWQRREEPFAGAWSLPGGGVGEGEKLGESLARQLKDKVDLREIAHLEQLETRSEPERDPRGRSLATAYLGLVPPQIDHLTPEDTSWHPLSRLPRCAFDHASIIKSAAARMRAKLSYTNIGFALAPETFTLAELARCYSAALGYPISATNLQRVLLRRSVIVPTGTIAGASKRGGRPAAVYRFAARELRVTNEFAAFRPAQGRAMTRQNIANA